MPSKLAVVIPVKGQRQYLEECIRSLCKYTATNWMLILIDNNDDEGGVKWAKKYCETKKIPCITQKFSGMNLSKAWNVGVKKAQAADAKFIAVINSDVVVYKDWWLKFDEMFGNDTDGKIWMATPNGSRLEKPIDWEYQAERALANTTIQPTSQRGWFMVFRALTFDPVVGVGLFDEQFKLWYGDTDMWIRLQNKQRMPVVLHSVFIHHYESKTLNALSAEEKDALIDQDTKLFHDKWDPKPPTTEHDDRPGVTIAIPTMGTIRTELFNHMLNLIANESRYAITILTTAGKSFHDYARNTLVEEFLTKTKDEWLVFIDDDIIPPNNFLDMLQHNEPVVGAVAYTYVNGNLQATIYKHISGKQYEPDRDTIAFSGLKEVDATGAACLAIKREVLEKMKKPYFKFEFDPETGVRTFGEDFYFCAEAKKLGYKIYVDTSIVTDHMKELSMYGMFKTIQSYTRSALIRADEERKELARKIMGERKHGIDSTESA